MVSRESSGVLYKAADSVCSYSVEDEALLSEDFVPPKIQAAKSHADLLHYVSPGLRRRGYAALAAATCALAVVVLLAAGSDWRGSPLRIGVRSGSVVGLYHDGACSGWELLQSEQAREGMVRGLLRVGEGLLRPADELYVRESVAGTMREASIRLEVAAPELVLALKQQRLGPDQQEAVLTSLRLISDSRLHSVGLDVARAIRGSALVDEAGLRRHVEDKLATRLAGIVLLRDDVITRPLRDLWKDAHQWETALAADNVRAMQSASGRVVDQDLLARRGVDLQEIAYGLRAAALEELRALLHALKLAARGAGAPSGAGAGAASFPPLSGWFGSLGEWLGQEPLTCELVTLRDNQVDAIRALFCPLRFGAQGLDALRAADAMSLAHPGLMVSASNGAAGF